MRPSTTAGTARPSLPPHAQPRPHRVHCATLSVRIHTRCILARSLAASSIDFRDSVACGLLLPFRPRAPVHRVLSDRARTHERSAGERERWFFALGTTVLLEAIFWPERLFHLVHVCTRARVRAWFFALCAPRGGPLVSSTFVNFGHDSAMFSVHPRLVYSARTHMRTHTCTHARTHARSLIHPLRHATSVAACNIH